MAGLPARLSDMPILIEYNCQRCLATIEWIYEQDDGLTPSDVRGCPGQGCTELHELSVREITDDELAERSSGNLFRL